MPTGTDEDDSVDRPNEVESLFDRKSAGWGEKYGMKGSLRPRLDAFAEKLEGLIKPPAKVLDFGCGTGNLARHLSERGYVVSACDISSRMVERARAAHHDTAVDWHLLPAGWSELPFGFETFDAVIASSVFEYLTSIEVTLAQCRRILKPDGYLIATVPNPRHLIRKLEVCLRPLSPLVDKIPGLNRIPRVAAYATYLQCSRNRMPLDEWLALGEQAQLAALQNDQNVGRKPGLVMLIFRKTSV